MKKILIQAGTLVVILAIILFAIANSLYDTPYEYTKKYGNEETKKIYAAYVMSKELVPLKRVLKYIDDNNLEYFEIKEEKLVVLKGVSKGHDETILIWHKDGKTIGARFDDFL